MASEKEVKKLISSVLCSSPRGLTIRNFDLDFYNLVGKHVPYKSFGYPTLESYLRSIPDTCEVQGTGDHAVLIHVVTKNLEHMNALIVNQKTVKTNNRRITINRPRGIKLIDEYKSKDDARQQKVNRPRSIRWADEWYPSEDDTSSASSSSMPTDDSQSPITTNGQVSTKYSDLIRQLCKRVKKQSLKSDSENCNSNEVSQVVQNRLSVIAKEYPGDLPFQRLLILYQNKYNEELDPYQFNCSSISELCCMLENKVFHITKPNQSGYVLYDVNLPKPNKNTKPNPKTLNIKGYPSDVVTLGEEIEVQNLRRQFKKSNLPLVPIKVVNITDPSNFYFQYEFDENFINKRDNLLDLEMQLFYEESSKNYIVRQIHVQENLHCVVSVDDYYYRAVVVQCVSNSVQVFLFDFGNITVVERINLFYLADKFSLLPKQAIFACLSFLKPNNELSQLDIWSDDSIKRFLELIEDKKCVGQITSVDVELCKIHVIIYDVTDSDIDVIVNDTLIDEGYAIAEMK